MNWNIIKKEKKSKITLCFWGYWQVKCTINLCFWPTDRSLLQPPAKLGDFNWTPDFIFTLKIVKYKNNK